MQADVREHQHVKVGTALAAASVVALAPIAPIASSPSPLSVVERAVQLTADDVVDLGLLNVPLNLFQTFINIGANEIAAEDGLAKSLFYATNFFVPSATNIFGTDPGDLLHYNSVLGLFLPFSRDLSGLGSPVVDPEAMANGTEPLAQQISLFAAAELPTNASSDADWSSPLAPGTPITGLAGIDRLFWGLETFTGGQKFPIIDNWLQVPLSKLMSGDFSFTGDNVPGGVDEGALAEPNEGPGYIAEEGQPGYDLPGHVVQGGVPSDDVFGGIGTHPLLTDDGTEQVLNSAGNPINLMPWTGLDFKLDLMHPFQAFFQSLMDPVDLSFHYGLPPDTDTGLAGELHGFVIPSLQDIMQASQSLMAGSVIGLDPFTQGSPFCGGICADTGFQNIVDAVKQIGQWAGGNNPLINHWLDLVATPSPVGTVVDPISHNVDMTDAISGSANYATPHQISSLEAFLQGDQNMFDFGNPGPDHPPIGGPLGVDTANPFDINPMIQNLIDFMKTSGIQDFVHQIADAFGYQPLDYGDGLDYDGTGMGDAPTTTATDAGNFWSELMNPADWGNLGSELTNDWASLF